MNVQSVWKILMKAVKSQSLLAAQISKVMASILSVLKPGYKMQPNIRRNLHALFAEQK